MEFVDSEGKVLGKIWPDKEYPEMYEHVSVYQYLMPHTRMRSFSDKICALQ